MQTFIFIFGNSIQERRFKTTYDAMCEYLDANHQYEDIFYAKDAQGELVNLLKAEALVKSVHPVKEYLEIAALAGFGKEQILRETKELCGVANDTLPASWTQFMEEFIEGYNEYLKEKSSRYGLVTWPESQDYVGHPDCILVVPPQEDTTLSLDSAYLVPESVTGPLDAGEAYVRVPFPDAQKWDGKAARGFADILHGYDSRDAYVRESVLISKTTKPEVITLKGVKYKEVTSTDTDKICKGCAYFLDHMNCDLDPCPCRKEDGILAHA